MLLQRVEGNAILLPQGHTVAAVTQLQKLSGAVREKWPRRPSVHLFIVTHPMKLKRPTKKNQDGLGDRTPFAIFYWHSFLRLSLVSLSKASRKVAKNSKTQVGQLWNSLTSGISTSGTEGTLTCPVSGPLW